VKLATRGEDRDGELLVVSRDLSRAVRVGEIAPTLQGALDRWGTVAEELASVYERLNDGALEASFPFVPKRCAAPLPRAYQWADGSAYVNHVELVRRARGADMPASFWREPLIYQGGSDVMLGPTDDIVVRSSEWGLDFEAEIAVIVDDVEMGTSTVDAGDHIKLLMLVNDVSLRGLIPGELDKGFGFYQSKPATAFSPVAVSPDELCGDWRENKVHRPLLSYVNGRLFGRGRRRGLLVHCRAAHDRDHSRWGAADVLPAGGGSGHHRNARPGRLQHLRLHRPAGGGRDRLNCHSGS
jgi:fumarylacetoacetate (FAA) hydrolase